jgi:fucose permease
LELDSKLRHGCSSQRLVFPAALIAYARLKNEDRANPLPASSARTAIGISVALVMASVAGLTLLTTAGNQYLPILLFDRTHAFRIPLVTINLSIMALATLAMIELWVRRRTLLDYWLMLISFALILEEACFSMSRVRSTLGYYAGRVFWLITSIVVLLLLVREMTRIAARQVHALNGQKSPAARSESTACRCQTVVQADATNHAFDFQRRERAQ